MCKLIINGFTKHCARAVNPKACTFEEILMDLHMNTIMDMDTLEILT